MKRTLIKVILILSLFLSPIFTSTASAAAGDLIVSGITTPLEANGTYTLAGTRPDGYNYWSLTAGSTTYVIYNDPYTFTGGSRYWNLDTDFNDEAPSNVLFYSSTSSTEPTPTGLSWKPDAGVGPLTVTSWTPTPNIAVLGNGNAIDDGSTTISSANFTNIGSASTSGGTASRIFTINNTGSAALTLSGSSPYVTISGTNASNFSVTAAPAQSIAASTGTTTFTITFTPSFEGYHNAVVTINNNDPDDEGIYTFNIQGYGFVARSVIVSGITEPSAANGTYLHQGVINNSQYWKHQTLDYYLYFDIYNGVGYWDIDKDTVIASSYFFKASEDGVPIGLTSWSADTAVTPLPTGSPVISYAVLAPEINLKGNSTTIATNDNTPSFTDQTNFGSVDISTGSRTRTYTIENTGGAALTIAGVTLGGSDASEFSKTNPVLTTIPASGSTTFTVTFDPTTTGTKTAALSIASNDADENPYLFTISGDAFTPKNLLVSDITTPPAANGTYIYQGILNEFQYWKHESLGYYIFNDEYTNAYYWNIDVDTDDSDIDYLFFRGSEAVAPVGLTGWNANTTHPGYESSGAPTIVYAGPEMDVKGNGNSIPNGSSAPTTTNATDFGSVSVVSGSVSHTFTIDNTGSSVLNLGGTPIVAVLGTNSGDFTVSPQPTTPVAATTGTTTFTVAFDPSGGGTRSATISIANDDSDENPYNFSIQGTGLAAPTLTTSAAASISTTTATLGGNITSDGGVAVTERGVVYSTTDATPTIGEPGVTQNTNGSGTGVFSESIGSLSLVTYYYYQAYATNTQGTAYGGVQEFTTLNTVTSIERAGSSPTNAASVSWDVKFDAPVTGLTSSNFTLANTGLTGPAITVVSGSGTDWTVTSSTGTGSGTLGLNLTSDVGLNAGLSNIPFTGAVYTIDATAPTVTINQKTSAPAQADPTGTSPINFTVVFSESVGTSFVTGDVTLSGTAGATTGTVTEIAPNDGTTYNVAVSGMTGDGTVIASILAGRAQDSVGNGNLASTSTDNSVLYDIAPPSVTINQAGGQSDPTNGSPINFTVVFSETVTGFATGDVTLTGTAGATTATVTGSGATYNVAVSGMTNNGTVIVSIPASVANDLVSKPSDASTSSDDTVTYNGLAPTVTTVVASGVTTTGATLNGTVNAYNASTAVTFEYGLTTTYGTTVTAAESPLTGTAATGVTAAISGLTPNSLYHFRAVGSNVGGTANGFDQTFTTGAVAPTVTTNAASGVTTTGATLNGTVNANNASTAVTFEYGLTTGYGTIVTAAESPLTGTAATGVTYTTIGGLIPNTLYHFRVVGGSVGGTTNGSDLTFTTGLSAPTVTTNAATLVTVAGATLNGTVNANNDSATVAFEYGTTIAYGSTVTATPGTVTGIANTPVSAMLTGMVTNTTYHYRVVAVNGGGPAYGGDLTFTTLGTTVTTVIHDAAEATITAGTIGMSVHDSATVVANGGGPAPTGTVTFTAYDNPNCSGTGTSVGTTSLIGNLAHPSNTVTVAYSGISFRATYNGDGVYNSSTGACVALDTPPVVMNSGVEYNASGNPLADFQVVMVGLNKLLVTFNRDVQNLPSTDPNYIDSVINPANYMLVNNNGNGFDDNPIPTTCLTNINPNGGDDLKVPVDSVSYSNGGGSGPFVATLNINGGQPLANGTYRLYVCGTTSITDPTGLVELAGNSSTAGSDFIRNFIVNLASGGTGTGTGGGHGKSLKNPTTGFEPGIFTNIPWQPAEKAYTDLGSLWIEIPSLGVKTSISGVPLVSDGWDLTWLNRQVGWLEGTAYPTWNGNTVLTAHAYTSDGLPGPFALLKNLKYGDTFAIHFGGQKYTYAVRSRTLVDAGDTRLLTKHETLDWVTLITCQQFDEKSKTYLYRWVVRAVLTDVQSDK
jgi:LPXTG-site transpeptidase (sortase) family protein